MISKIHINVVSVNLPTIGVVASERNSATLSMVLLKKNSLNGFKRIKFSFPNRQV